MVGGSWLEDDLIGRKVPALEDRVVAVEMEMAAVYAEIESLNNRMT